VFVIRLPSRSLGEGWCFVIRLSCIVVSELPKTATGKVQKYVLRGKQPAISKQ
jgi:acyl-CoA synthetase (AMP-forming)/AMP-acid ligase II